MRLRYSVTIGVILFFATMSMLLLATPDQAVAAVCTDPNYANNNPTTVYPRFRTGMQESSCPNNAESYIWMSEYWSGSTVNTPTSYIRIFYDISAINSQPYTFDTVSFQTLNNNNHRCGSNVRVQLGGQTQNMYKNPSNFCTISMPAGLSVNKGMLQQNAAYGPDIRYVDLVMQQLTLDSNAPIRVVSSFWGAKITTVDDYTGGNTNIALWSGVDSSNFITYVANFGTPCDIPSGDTISTTLRWYDADTNAPPQNSNLFIMYLVDDTTGLHVTPAGGLRSDAYDFGGDNVNRAYGPVNLIAGHKYRWIWSGIQKNNGIQIRVPYSEVLYDVDCPNAATDATITCPTVSATSITLRWSTANTTNARIRRVSPAGTVGTNLPANGGPTDRVDSGRTASTSYTYQIRNNSDTGTILDSVTCTTTDLPQAPSINCPSYPPNTLNFNTIQRVNLPRSPVGGQGHDTDAWTVSNVGPTNGPTFGPTQSGRNLVLNDTTQTRQIYRSVTYTRVITYTQVYRNPTNTMPRTTIDSIRDPNWPTPNSLTIPTVYRDASGDFIYLDYANYFNGYPYDQHTPIITYRIAYERRQRVGTRTQTYTATQYGSRTRTKSASATRFGSYGPEQWGPVPGANFSTPPSSPTTVTNNDNLSYSGRRDASNPIRWSGIVPTVTAPRMPPCYPRRYNATPSITGAVLNTNRENPTSSTVTFTIPTILSFTNGGNLRTPTTVTGLGYRVDWQARGYSTTAAGFTGTYSGTVNIVNPLGSPANLGNNINGTAGTTGTLSQTTQSFTVPANMQAGDQVCFTVTVGEAIGRVKTGGEIWPPGNTSRTTALTCTVTIVDQPYSRFYGADISAGGGFNTDAGPGTCSAVNPNAQAFGPMRTDIFAGSGSQLAVFAINAIRGVQPLSRSTRQPTQLAFSNTSPNVTARLFGGNFGSLLCAHNYFDDIPGNTIWDTTTANVNLAAPEIYDTDRHYIDGDITLTGQLPENATAGKRVVIYVDGNVTVQAPSGGKVGFATTSYEWSSIDLVPSLYVIARGNININSGVTQLDGSFISQGGEITSCTVGGVYPTPSQRTEQCRNQLRVNGAFIARKVNLLRTFGSLREGVALEAPSSTRASETFMYNPALWFTQGGGLPSNSKIQIDSYTSLPPSL